jgi:CheY-like chemotaxis protein
MNFGMNQNPSTVLVIDDDHSVAELIACFLAHAKLRAVIAPNGIAGLQQAQALLPDLILCDSCMPGLAGLELIEKLRSDSATAHIPIVLMSGYEAARFDGSGANAFLQKPFQISEMLALTQRFVCKPSIAIADESGRATECVA